MTSTRERREGILSIHFRYPLLRSGGESDDAVIQEVLETGGGKVGAHPCTISSSTSSVVVNSSMWNMYVILSMSIIGSSSIVSTRGQR